MYRHVKPVFGGRREKSHQKSGRSYEVLGRRWVVVVSAILGSLSVCLSTDSALSDDHLAWREEGRGK